MIEIGQLIKDKYGIPLIVLSRELCCIHSVSLIDGAVISIQDEASATEAFAKISLREAWHLYVAALAKNLESSRRDSPFLPQPSDFDQSPGATADERFNLGDLYEDGICHPCLCFGFEGSPANVLLGVSLVTGGYPHAAMDHMARKLSPADAWAWRMRGPQGYSEEEIAPVFLSRQKWWL